MYFTFFCIISYSPAMAGAWDRISMFWGERKIGEETYLHLKLLSSNEARARVHYIEFKVLEKNTENHRNTIDGRRYSMRVFGGNWCWRSGWAAVCDTSLTSVTHRDRVCVRSSLCHMAVVTRSWFCLGMEKKSMLRCDATQGITRYPQAFGSK